MIKTNEHKYDIVIAMLEQMKASSMDDEEHYFDVERQDRLDMKGEEELYADLIDEADRTLNAVRNLISFWLNDRSRRLDDMMEEKNKHPQGENLYESRKEMN